MIKMRYIHTVYFVEALKKVNYKFRKSFYLLEGGVLDEVVDKGVHDACGLGGDTGPVSW